MNAPVTTGPAVVLSGRWLAVVRQAVFAANVARRRNGLPDSRDYAAVLGSIAAAMSPVGHNVVDSGVVAAVSIPPEELTVEEAAGMLARSHRQVQRMAPKLGGRRIGGRWLLDRRAVEEHVEGARP